MDFIEHLAERSLIQDVVPGTKEKLASGMQAGYIGFDPTAASLHIGNLATLMLLKRFQMAGHKPYILVGGATGMVGDPSGKSAERNLLNAETLAHNIAGQKSQLVKFLDFNEAPNSAEVVNNYDWFKEMNVLDFLRDVGKHLTVNYMMAKDSVKKRLETGLSFTEFSYQLIQGYDFYYLWKHHNVILQMGGSDQWGNITTGTEFIRRMDGGEAFALTTPLLTKADGSKFGKSESGNIWLDAELTSPYAFYQYFLNSADEDVPRFLRVFSLKTVAEIKQLEVAHAEAPHLRIMQKALAEELTTFVHGKEEFTKAVQASEVLFGKAGVEELQALDKKLFTQLFEGVPQMSFPQDALSQDITTFLGETTKTIAYPSKGEARKAIQAGAVSINGIKVTDVAAIVESLGTLHDEYILIRKGKKEYRLVKIVK